MYLDTTIVAWAWATLIVGSRAVLVMALMTSATFCVLVAGCCSPGSRGGLRSAVANHRPCTDTDIGTGGVDTHGGAVVGLAFTSLPEVAAAAIEDHRPERLYRPDDTGTATASSVPCWPARSGGS
jgi:hypothetical protein